MVNRNKLYLTLLGAATAGFLLRGCVDSDGGHARTTTEVTAAPQTTPSTAPSSRQRQLEQAQAATDGQIMLSRAFEYGGAKWVVTCFGPSDRQTVKKGDSISAVETTQYHNSSNLSEKPVPEPVYEEAIAVINGINDPNKIYPNEVLVFPQFCNEGTP